MTAAGLELGLGPHVGVHRPVRAVGHRGLGAPQRPYGPIQTARGPPPCSSEAENLEEADQADAVAGGDVEGDAGQQQTCAHAHVDVTNGDHEKTLRTSTRTHGWRGSGSSARKFGA
jgi:hypothetical protein